MDILNSKNIWAILEKSFNPRAYPKNYMIYRQGYSADKFYYLKSGKIKIFISSENGMEKTLTVKENGGVFGEAAFFDGMPRVSSAKTITASEIIVITRQEMMDCIKKEPQFAMDLLTYLSQTVRMLSAQLDTMTFHHADERLAGLLLTLASGGTVFATHDDLADLAGVSRVTVSRVLARFAKEGWVAISYRKVKITNPNGLKDFMGSKSM